MLIGVARADAASLTLAWDRPTEDDTVGYVLWYGTAPGRYTAQVNVGFLTQYSVRGLADGTTYCFAVQAYDKEGAKSPLSAEVCGETPNGTPPAEEPLPEDPEDPEVPEDPPPSGGVGDVVLYASDARGIRGNWAKAASIGAAGGQAMRSVDRGWSSPDRPLSAPEHYFDLTFDASANTQYRVWLRLRAAGNSKWNDAVWVQFSDALVSGSPKYRMGTTEALLVNLERCDGCGVSGWGWQNTAFWLNQGTMVTFASSGAHRLRVQTREDGVEIDQVVLSAVKYKSVAPGSMTKDATILAKSTASTATSPITAATSTPYDGTPIAVPGRIDAAHFDEGDAGVAYSDTTPGNTGDVFRTTDVDLQTSSPGGYNIAWTAAGEWVTYTVNVESAGTYYAKLGVASRGGGAVQIAAGAPSNSARDVAVPDTRDAQAWTTVTVPLTLASGTQTFTVRFLTGNVSLHSISLTK